MLSRFDPFQQFERLVSSSAAVAGLPMDVYRRGDDFVIDLDVPGLAPDSIEVTVDRGVVSVSAERTATWQEGDRVFVAERPHGSVTRRIALGTDVDGERVAAEYRDGVLTIVVPVAEGAKPHRVAIGAGHREQELAAQSS